MDLRLLLKDIYHIGLLLILIFILLFVLTWIGLIKCSLIPGWCDVYWMVLGKPKVLIVYGNTGLGDPELLKSILADPNILGIRATSVHISHINLGNLKEYDLVIVEKARKVSTDQLQMFMSYVNEGGRLVWTGDAGTELEEGDELLYEDERSKGKEHVAIGPWARKKFNKMVSFDQLLSVNYVGNFCDFKPCEGLKGTFAGVLVPEPTGKHSLVYGLASNLPLRVYNNEDFSIVKKISGGLSTEVLSLDFGGNLFTEDGKNLGVSTPLIVTSGFGERVAYYAMPPEYYANPRLEKKYYSIIENMYLGMLRG